MVGEPGQVDAVFLARNCLRLLALLDIKDLDRLVITGSHQVFALVVEIQGRDVGWALLLGRSEGLGSTQSPVRAVIFGHARIATIIPL